jgi:hypothetical protein
MYSFVYNKTRNCLGVEKAEALVYIYTNSRLLRQRPGTDPVRYYNDNIFSKDFDDDGEALSEMDDDDNDDNHDNGSKGHEGSDGDASDGREEHCREYLLVNPKNVRYECSFDWNEIDEEVANSIDKYTAMGPIGNVHVNEDAPIGFAQHGYNQADEEPNDDNYNEVANEHGEENGNTHGHNGDSNDCGLGGASGIVVGSNIDTTSIGNGDGGPNNAPKEEPTKE